ncbi:MAG: APC family permease [Halapricum sp.]
MASRPLSWLNAEAYALGGILGSGIFSVLGVVLFIAGSAAWVAYLLAGIIAVCTSYSYVQLNEASDFHGGAVTLVLEHNGRPALAGMIGWLLLTGFLGLLAMYGYVFGAYAAAFVPAHTVAIRPMVSAACIALFVGLNWIGAGESSRIETAIVGLNVVLVVVFAGVAAWHIHATPDLHYDAALGGQPIGRIGVAAATAFVSLVAWQILMYDQSRMANPATTLDRTVRGSLPLAIGGYAILSMLLASLLGPGSLAHDPELVLLSAADAVSRSWAFVVVGAVALGAIAAAINAIVFSTALFLEGLISYRLFPDAAAELPSEQLPRLPLLLIGAVSILVATVGRIEAIVEFSTLAFTVTNAIVSYLALRADQSTVARPVALVGLFGAGAFVATTLWWLAVRDPSLLLATVGIGVCVVALEVLYFDRGVQAADQSSEG